MGFAENKTQNPLALLSLVTLDKTRNFGSCFAQVAAHVYTVIAYKGVF